jgi:AraC-like DNA-binding protein
MMQSMNTQDVLSEIVPLSDGDCFYVIERLKSEFSYPIHNHPEYELNFIENARDAQRIVGDSIEEIDDLELVLITGENVEHAWVNHRCHSNMIREITIQFHPNLFKEFLLNKSQFNSIKEMFEKAQNGLVFSKETIERVRPLLMSMTLERQGFYSVIKLLTILYELSQSIDARVLASSSFLRKTDTFDSRRVKKVSEYIEKHFSEKILMTDMAGLAHMSEGAFSRFIKKRTGKSFTDYITDVRIGHAIRMLVDSTHPVSEIAFLCGFNNLSNFNRIFKKKKGLPPKDFRLQYRKKKVII